MEKRETRTSSVGRPDIFYARVARDYEALFLAGVKNINQQIAKHMKVSPSKVRDMIYQARHRGLLSNAPAQGKKGGTLTAKAKTLLQENKPRKKRRR